MSCSRRSAAVRRMNVRLAVPRACSAPNWHEARPPRHAPRAATLNSGFDEVRRKEGKRDRHVDFSDAAAFALRKGFSGCGWIGGEFIEPTTSSGNNAES